MFKLYGLQFLVMLLLNTVVTLSFTVYNVAIYFYYGFEHSAFLTHILQHMLLNFFLSLLVATLVGWVLALVFKRLMAYMIAIVFLFLGSRIFEEMVDTTLFSTGRNLYPIYNFFSFSDPAITWATNFHIGYSVLPDRFWMMFSWIVALVGVILFKLIRKGKQRYIYAALTLFVFAISIYFYQQPRSRFVMSHTPNGSLMYDPFHYRDQDIQVGEANFSVLTYDLEMTVGNQLHVTATLTVDEQLPEYRFTLYHRYVIRSVIDQDGIAMDFVQDGDHFRIYNTNARLEAMIIYYVGYSPRFYSNRQGIILPGFFPYFPQPGYHLIFDYQWGAFEPLMLPQEAYFNIRISGAGDVFSNLDEIASNHFSGRTSSVTLMSGFLNSHVVDGITVVYPFLDHMEFNQELNTELTQEFIRDFSGSNAIQTIMVLPNLNLHHMMTVAHSDHITTTGLFDLAELSYQSFINPRKMTLYWLLDLYLNEREWFDYEVDWELSVDMYDQYRYAVMMQNHIEAMGEEVFLNLAFSYIEDDTDRRSISEFLLELE